MIRKIIKTTGKMMCIYGGLTWLYVMVINFTYPEWLAMPFSHLTLWIRTDTVGMIAFVISAVGFWIWEVTKEDG